MPEIGRPSTSGISIFVKASHCITCQATLMVSSSPLIAALTLLTSCRLDRNADQHAGQRYLLLHQRSLPCHRECRLLTLSMSTLLTRPAQWRDGIPQGWLARDHPAWFRSTQRLKQLERTTKGQVIPGHDKITYENLISKGKTFT